MAAPDDRGRPAALDEVDRAIVAALRSDGRMSMRTLAATVHISRAGAYGRVQRLERDGVIIGYAATVDVRKLGQTVAAYVQLSIAQQSWQRVEAQLVAIEQVQHAALVSGDHDIVLLVRTADVAELRDVVLTRLQELPEVRSTQTVLIFDEAEHRATPTER